MTTDIRFTCLRAAALLLAAACAPALAQTWPAKPVTLVAVFAAGGPVDMVARIVAKGLGEQLGQQVVVENRVGAGGTVGAGSVARANADGYTVLLVNSGHTAAEALYKGRGYDLAKDFAPVSLIGTSPNWLLVNPKQNAFASLQEMTAFAAAHPGKLTYASGGSGGLTHLSSELMKAQKGLDIVHVPYKGNSPAFTDLLAGRVDMIFDQPISSEAFVRSGQLKPLAVTSRNRMPGYPDVPTMAEAGFPGFVVDVWYGLAFRAGTPPAVVSSLNAALEKVLASPDIKSRLTAAGVTPAHSTPAAFEGRIKDDTARWRGIIERSGITAQ